MASKKSYIDSSVTKFRVKEKNMSLEEGRKKGCLVYNVVHDVHNSKYAHITHPDNSKQWCGSHTKPKPVVLGRERWWERR